MSLLSYGHGIFDRSDVASNHQRAMLFIRHTFCVRTNAMKHVATVLCMALVGLSLPSLARAQTDASGDCAGLSGSIRISCEQSAPQDEGNRPGEKAQAQAEPGANFGAGLNAGIERPQRESTASAERSASRRAAPASDSAARCPNN
jgi:hypothetical protein